MKINFPRHIVYMVLFTIFMITFAIWFATAELIPMGKEYRKKRLTLKKQEAELARYQEFYNQTQTIHNNTKAKNRHIIQAFQNSFSPKKFEQEYQKYFVSLKLTKAKPKEKKEWYDTYEVNTTSKITSPKNFYNFLEALNKSPWIVEVTFPIDFTKEGELIHSHFSMLVYKKTNNSLIPQKEE